jgi:hypothetical protein
MTSTMNGVNVSVGLSADEAARQLALHGPNELPHDRGKGILRLGWEVMRALARRRHHQFLAC